MKMTLELPDDLVREMKLRAVREGRKLKDVAEEVFRQALAPVPGPARVRLRKVELPLIKCRRRARPNEALTPERVADILIQQEIPGTDVSARR